MPTTPELLIAARSATPGEAPPPDQQAERLLPLRGEKLEGTTWLEKEGGVLGGGGGRLNRETR